MVLAIFGARRQADRRALVQRVPPAHREIDDRDVDRADDREQRAGLVGAPHVVDRLDQRDVAEVQEQQDQLRRQPRVPHPPGAPRRLAPERAGPQRDEGEHRAGRRERAREHRRHASIEHPADRRPHRHHQVHDHRHPRGRHVDEDDAVGLALRRVGRRDEEADVQAGRGECKRGGPAATARARREAVEARRRGEGEPADAASHASDTLFHRDAQRRGGRQRREQRHAIRSAPSSE